MLENERTKFLNKKSICRKDYVLYWMQASQREHYNHALEFAVQKANELHKPLLVLFGLTDEYPSANLRHYHFMLHGLKQTQIDLQNRGIQMVIQHKSPEIAAVEFAQDACLIITDRGYLKHQRQWRSYVARNIECPMVQVESDIIVPVEQAAGKEQYSAATLRPRIHRQLDRYLKPVTRIHVKYDSLGFHYNQFDIDDIQAALDQMHIDKSVAPVKGAEEGTFVARKLLKYFIEKKLDQYNNLKNDPNADVLSQMSSYLHFGQISPLYIALQISRTQSPGKNAYLEELIVRRELAINFVYYNKNYASFTSLPNWARANLKTHQSDPREYIYTQAEFEDARTHDPYWNAAQMQMKITGKMHGYMRMYWGKKILEWTRSPRRAYQLAVYLNDKYQLDGRDPNGYAGVAWCFGKHDRPWNRRPIFGSVRYMNAKGLKRKFDADAYVASIEKMKTLSGK